MNHSKQGWNLKWKEEKNTASTSPHEWSALGCSEGCDHYTRDIPGQLLKTLHSEPAEYRAARKKSITRLTIVGQWGTGGSQEIPLPLVGGAASFNNVNCHSVPSSHLQYGNSKLSYRSYSKNQVIKFGQSGNGSRPRFSVVSFICSSGNGAFDSIIPFSKKTIFLFCDLIYQIIRNFSFSSVSINVCRQFQVDDYPPYSPIAIFGNKKILKIITWIAEPGLKNPSGL